MPSALFARSPSIQIQNMEEDVKPELPIFEPQAITTSVSSPLPAGRQPIQPGAYSQLPERQTQSSPFATLKKRSALLKDHISSARPATPANRKRKREVEPAVAIAGFEGADELGRLEAQRQFARFSSHIA
jgi:hypothetical protein